MPMLPSTGAAMLAATTRQARGVEHPSPPIGAGGGAALRLPVAPDDRPPLSRIEAEAYAGAVVDCAAEAIVSVDPSQRIALVNRAAERLFGYRSGELVGQPTALLFPEGQADAPLVGRPTRIGPPGDPVERWEMTCRRQSGTEFPAEIAISRMLTGGREHLVAVVRDVTERRRAEALLRESEERFHQAFSSAAVGMAIVSLDGRWLDVNGALCRQLGYSSAEMRTLTFQEVTHPDDLESDIEQIRQLLSGDTTSYIIEKRYIHRGGAVIWVLLAVSLVRDAGGTPLYFLAQVQDISERKAAEEELRRRSEELARSNTELEQFAYVASHDLQEPLRMVASYTELLAKRYGGRLDDRADKWIGYAADGARRLQTLIADLLSLSHIGSTEVPADVVDMNEVLDRALAPLLPALAESGGRVVRQPLPRVTGDAVQLELVLRNLLSNAIKFRRPAEPPRVTVSAEPAADLPGGWSFSVRDNGIGLDMKFAERIFVIFQRLHTREENPGTGIGLAACRKIVERHGGRIWVESEHGEGTTMRFTLPGHAAG